MDEGLAGDGFLSQSMFKMQQLDAYIGEFQRRYRVFRRRKEEPVWLYSSWDHSINPAYCPECGTIPCMAQQFDPVLEIMCSPHMKLVDNNIGGGKATKKRLRADLDPVGIQAVANELFDEVQP
jgi:hypothetical protein